MIRATKRMLALTAALTIGLTLTGCDLTRRAEGPHNQMIVMLVDLSGSFEEWLQPSFETVARRIGPKGLRPGDTICVIGIDDNSYEDENVIYGPKRTDPSLLVFSQEMPKIMEELEEIGQTIEAGPHKGTDIEGALHLAADYLARTDDCWLNLLIFSDMVQQQQNPSIDLADAPQLPAQARMTCLFVPRREGEREYSSRKSYWRAKLSEYGLSGNTPMEFLDPNSSRAENLAEATVRAMTRRPVINEPGEQS